MSNFGSWSIYDYGGRIKLVFSSVSHHSPGGAPKSLARERISQSISRAKSRVFELALCNNWDYFATFTQNSDRLRSDLYKFRLDFAQFVRNCNRSRSDDNKLHYLCVPELHKDGQNWHMHGLISGLSPDDLVKNEHGYLDWLGYRSRFGWVSLSPIKSKQKIASYITKYISKDVFSTAEVLKSGSHLYYASQGLNGRAVVADHMHPDSLPKKLAANWDFENDYCKIRWFDSLEDLQKACL